MDRPRKITTSVGPTLTVTPFSPSTGMISPIELPLMVIDFLMVKGLKVGGGKARKSPGSRTEISPPELVTDIVKAKVLHGAVRLQGKESSPTPDTQVCGKGCPCADEAIRRRLRPSRKLILFFMI